MSKRVGVGLLLFFTLGSAGAGGDLMPSIKVLPWNAHPAAVCLTFDGGDSSQLDVALPELNSRGMKATFFLIGNQTDRKDDWRKILIYGHEIGSNSLDHRHIADLITPRDLDSQVVGAQNVLQKEFGVSLYSFAYPYGEVTPRLRTLVGENHLLARGGDDLSQPDLKIGVEPDWLNLPSRKMDPNLSWATYQSWIDKDLKDGAWLIFKIPSLEEAREGYPSVSRHMFTQLLDYLQSKDVWVGTVLQVGSYFLGQNIFEKAERQTIQGKVRYQWKVPSTFPSGVVLQFTIATHPSPVGVYFPVQKGKKLKADGNGIYTLDFSKGELELLLLPKS